MRERGGLGAAAADAAVAAAGDDVDAAPEGPRVVEVERVPGGARAVAAENIGAPASAVVEYSGPDLELTGFQQSVDPK